MMCNYFTEKRYGDPYQACGKLLKLLNINDENKEVAMKKLKKIPYKDMLPHLRSLMKVGNEGFLIPGRKQKSEINTFKLNISCIVYQTGWLSLCSDR